MAGIKLANNAWGEPFTTTQRRLVVITALLGMLTLGHDVDHLRRGLAFRSCSTSWLSALWYRSRDVGVLVRYRAWSRPVAIAQGITTVVGVGAVHVAPEWPHLSDSYAAADADALSSLIILAMILAALALNRRLPGRSLTGQRQLRMEEWPPGPSGQRLTPGSTCPYASVLVGGVRSGSDRLALNHEGLG